MDNQRGSEDLDNFYHVPVCDNLAAGIMEEE